jgi:hypothetical protein
MHTDVAGSVVRGAHTVADLRTNATAYHYSAINCLR